MRSERASESTGRVRVERGIYRQPNGRYAVCVMIDGRPSLRTVAGDLEQARVERELLREAAHNGLLTLWPRLTFGAVASQWLARFERRVATGERRERTLENYRYYLDHHLLPELGRKRIRSLTPADTATLIAALTTKGLAPKTVANALVPLGGILRFARRRGYILDDPLRQLEQAERPRPAPRAQRVLGQTEISDLLRACLPLYRPPLATALYTDMRLSELLALTWADVDFQAHLVTDPTSIAGQLPMSTADGGGRSWTTRASAGQHCDCHPSQSSTGTTRQRAAAGTAPSTKLGSSPDASK
jgi:integrase